jgi:hypothetical protein
MRKAIRQGDVLLRPVRAAKGSPMQPTNGRYILAQGEQTGHHHSIAAGPDIKAFLGPDGLFIDGTGTLAHQEHDPHTTDGGAYEVVIQRRATPDEHRPVRQAFD